MSESGSDKIRSGVLSKWEGERSRSDMLNQMVQAERAAMQWSKCLEGTCIFFPAKLAAANSIEIGEEVLRLNLPK
jgi:hypothetical protein